MPSTPGVRRIAPILALLAILTACASTGPLPDDEAVTLVVTNRRPQMVTIYAVRYSSQYRIGGLPGISERAFVLRPHMIGPGGELQLAIDPLGDPNRRFTHVLFVREGDTVQLELVF